MWTIRAGFQLDSRGAHDKIKEVYNAAAVGFDEPLTVTFGNERWQQFKEAMHIRHEITHPKNVNDCWIFEQDVQKVIAAPEWFKSHKTTS